MLLPPSLTNSDRRAQAAELLVATTVEMATSGLPLMRRVVPHTGYQIWSHYPSDDAVDTITRARWFYHAHPPEERDHDEHGHFHLFLDLDAFNGHQAKARPVDSNAPDARVVHIAALSINLAGQPTKLFTVNRWVTDEWLFDAASILERLETFDLSTATLGDPLVNRWLTAAVAALKPELTHILLERDRLIADQAGSFFERRDAEILSSLEIDLQRCITQIDR